VAPFPKAFFGEVADVVDERGTLFADRSEPNANVLRADAVVARLLDSVREASSVGGKPSAHGLDRFGVHRFHVLEYFDPESAFIEQCGDEQVFPIRAFSRFWIDVSFNAPSL